MRRPLLAALAALAAGPVAAPAGAETRQLGNVVIDLPADWEVGESDDGLQRIRIDVDDDVCPYCSLTVVPGGAAEGDLGAWLSANALAAVEPEDRGSVEVVTGPEVLQHAGHPAALLGQRVDTDIQILLAVDAGGRRDLLVFQGWAYDEEEATRSLDYYGQVVAPVLEGLAFVSAGAAPLMPDPVPGGLSGLWWGWNQGVSLGLDGMMTTTVEFRTLAFWPEGLFFDGTPPAGLATPTIKALSRSGATTWGTYREEDGAVVLTFSDGRVERLPRQGDVLADEARSLAPARPLPDGAPLDGRVEDFSYAALGPIGGDVSGGVASESSTVFHPDGTWEGSRFGGASATFSQGGTVTGGFTTDGGTQASSGTYEVRDGLVVMTPADGSDPTVALAFVTPEGETMVGELFLEAD